MEFLKAYLSGFFGLLLLTAILLPSFHAFEHSSTPVNDQVALETVKAEKSLLNCDLCDFHFSTIDNPTLQEYELYLPLKESLYSFAISKKVYLLSSSPFSLRAPPAVIA